MNIFKAIRASLRLYTAMYRADKAHKETGERYYVLPTPGPKGNLIIMDRYNFRKLKLKKYITRKANVSDMEKECFYCTPYSNGKDALPAYIIKMKRKEYFEWIASLKKPKKSKAKKNDK